MRQEMSLGSTHIAPSDMSAGSASPARFNSSYARPRNCVGSRQNEDNPNQIRKIYRPPQITAAHGAKIAKKFFSKVSSSRSWRLERSGRLNLYFRISHQALLASLTPFDGLARISPYYTRYAVQATRTRPHCYSQTSESPSTTARGDDVSDRRPQNSGGGHFPLCWLRRRRSSKW